MGNLIGCDVSKGWIDVHIEDSTRGHHMRVANERAAIKRWAQGLPRGSRIGMEATGQMHELLADTLHAAGHTVFVINARWIHSYRVSRGVRGKTDRTDAGVIARYVGAHERDLHRYVPPSPAQRELRSLLLRRRHVVKLKTAAAQSLGASAKALLREFKALLSRIDARVVEIIRSEPSWKDLAHRLKTEPGVGPVIAAHLVEVLSRFPFRSSDALVAHTGLDPRPNQSGQKIGRRRLTHHGDAGLRSMLYLAAMAACRKQPWKSLYELHRAKGLPSTAAYVVIARKLARIAFTLFKTGQSYDPTKLKMA